VDSNAFNEASGSVHDSHIQDRLKMSDVQVMLLVKNAAQT